MVQLLHIVVFGHHYWARSGLIPFKYSPRWTNTQLDFIPLVLLYLQPVPFPWSLLKEKELKPVNKVADMVAFSHKYTIHMKNLLHGKMLSLSPKECIFSLKSTNSRTAIPESWKEDLPTSFKALVFSVVKPCGIRFITRIRSNRNTFIQALVDDGTKPFCELRNT